jgi:hypothetical protein
MKKIVIPVVIVVFGVCAFFGFKAASKILAARQMPELQSTTTVEKPAINQKNYIFIHVNDLTLEKPELISVWAGFVNDTTPPQFMFLPLFPTYNAEIHERINKNFSMTTDKKVNQRFINQLQSLFDFQISGYVLTDDVGVGYSNLWASGVEAPVASMAASTDTEKHTLLLTGQTSWQQFCQLVAIGTANNYFSAINWGLLLPDHFSTSLDFESLTLLTDQIVHASSPVGCEVLSNE